jgi:cyclopropane fatty-acyl-phospholipid synthase-like methyltransferase
MLKIIEKSWNEFWAYYWRIEDRHKIPNIFEWDNKLVNFIEHVCSLSPGMRVLDLGCGGGDQAKVFVKKGYEVVGIDIAPSLIEFAKKQFKKKGLKGKFIVGDMRDIKYDAEFDVCVILSGTFGFFSDEENQRLLYTIRQALRIGGKMLLMFISANQVKKHVRTWQECKDGWELNETWYDNETGIYCGTVIIIKKDGTIIKPKSESGYHANETIRCYTIPELKKMLSKAGLRYHASYSSADLSVPPKPVVPETVRNIIVAERTGR